MDNDQTTGRFSSSAEGYFEAEQRRMVQGLNSIGSTTTPDVLQSAPTESHVGPATTSHAQHAQSREPATQSIPKTIHKTVHYDDLKAATGLGQSSSPTTQFSSDSYQTTPVSTSNSTSSISGSRDPAFVDTIAHGGSSSNENFGTILPATSEAGSTVSHKKATVADPGANQTTTASSIDRKPVPHSQNNDYDDVLRAEPTKFGQAYSERNPPPNVQAFREHESKRQAASKKYFEGLERGEAAKKSTGPDVKIGDGPASEDPTSKDGARSGATEDVPIGAEKSNVLFHPTPQVNFDRVYDTLEVETRRISYIIFGAIIVLDWLFIGGGIRGLLKSLFPASGVAATVYFILNHVGQQAKLRKMQKTPPKSEKLKFVPESVEWMNSLVNTLWKTLQQDFFDNIAHTIDDTIKPYIPSNIPATVKITDLGHGVQSARVLSMRSLPDSEFGDLVPTHGLDKSGSIEQTKLREKAIKREEGGVFYNLEMAVAYHAAPLMTRKQHMHVDILAMIGPVPLPIFIEVKEFVATIRIRLQMHPDLPFLKNVTFALTENPKVNTCVSIGAPWAFNILNLPIVDNVLANQIDAAASDFVQPKSMSMDMTVYVGGSDQKNDTEAVGVLFVKIHKARRLARQDTRGPGADPYLTIAFSKYEKPMYATRIIKGDRNPVWEETAIIMIKPEHVKRQENVLLRLWDSDTTGADDISGVCEFPLQELILNANKMEKREDQLQGDVAGTDAEGVLEWEIGYFPRAEYEKALRTDAKDPKDHHGDKKAIAEEEKEQNAQNTVPDPNLPSGILGLTIHQCINIQVDNPNKKSMGHVKVQRQDSDGEEEDEEDVSIDYVPSLYVTADINDQLVYRTRVKSINSAPTYNSSTEQYIRDWRLSVLNLAVWDTRSKADDCLVGVVAIKLSDIFQESSSVVQFFDLKGGEGTGRLRISMIFRSMRMQLERSLVGYSVGTFIFTSPIIATGDMKTSKLKLRASGCKRSIKHGPEKSGDTCTWSLADPDNKLPVHHRYLSPVVLEFVGKGLTEKISGPFGKEKHYAVMWLYKLVDNETNSFTLPIFKTDNSDRLTQNVVSKSDDTMKLEKVGEVKFEGVFRAGMDNTHEEFLDGRDEWSTFQSWKAARKSGQRDAYVSSTTNQNVRRLAGNIEKSQAIPV